MKREIELPETISFRRGGVDLTLSLTRLPVEIIAELVTHGLVQKVGDAASNTARVCAEAEWGEKWKGLSAAEKNKATADFAASGGAAAIREQAEASMMKVFDALEAGEWGVRRSAADGLDADDEERAKYVRDELGAKRLSAEIAGYKDMTTAQRLVAINDWIEADAARRTKINAAWERRKATKLDF